jgi:hypothetical protein
MVRHFHDQPRCAALHRCRARSLIDGLLFSAAMVFTVFSLHFSSVISSTGARASKADDTTFLTSSPS